jgi:aminoglycoside phosphotransferase (APT) family kinase protein
MSDVRLIASVARPVVGSISSVERVQGFVGNESFRLLTDNGETFYLKSGATEAIRAEAWACEQARQVDVLAPEVLTADLHPTDLPTAYLIEREISGQPTSAGEEGVLAAVGAQLRRLHSITGDGYGFLHEGLRETWTEAIRQPFDRISELTAAGIMPTDVATRLSAFELFAQGEPIKPVLLHGDLHPRHVYAADGKLTGIIDWGDAAFGDPLFDLGRFSRAGSAPTVALLTGYGIEGTPELDRTLAFYRVAWSLMALHWEHDAGGDWFAAHVDAIRSDLPYLEASN